MTLMDPTRKRKSVELNPTLISKDVDPLPPRIVDEIMEDQEQTNRKSMNQQVKRVPVFVLFAEGMEEGGYYAMELYAFDDTFCPTYGVNEHPILKYTPEDLPLPNAPFRAQPFTGFTSCPNDCSFASVGDEFYLVGGFRISSDLAEKIYLDPKKAESLGYPVSELSSRVLRFSWKQFVESLAENKRKGKIEFLHMDDEDSVYWEKCPSLSIPRKDASLLHLRGKLWVVGGLPCASKDPLIEVFDNGAWTPFTLHYPPEIDLYVSHLLAVALEDTNQILIASKEKFYKLDVGTAQWETLAGLEFPTDLVDLCSGQPGFVHKNCVMWYEDITCCIRGLDLHANKTFYVDLMDDVLHFEHRHWDDCENRLSAKLIDMRNEEGSLCLIYYGNMWCDAIDDRGVKYSICEYHFVTFQILFNNEVVDEDGRVGFEPRVIDRRKCYAPAVWNLGAAFVMDVDFPQDKNLPQDI